ncbi:MAG: aspartate aminotransferase family protein, partial [Dehalococcoidia bacterium]
MTDIQKYAISQYPDVADIYRRLEALVSQPMRRVRPEKMKEYLAYFDTKCVRSKALTDAAKKFIPGGVQHNLAFNYPFP